MEGIWPKRELGQEELLETYKNHYSGDSRREAMRLVGAFRKKFGASADEVIREVYAQAGKEEGASAKRDYGSLLNKVADYSVRPHCYKIHHHQSSEDRIAYKVLRCPLAEVLKDMGLEELGKHICLPYHPAFAKALGYKFTMPKFLLAGDDCCEHIWEKAEV